MHDNKEYSLLQVPVGTLSEDESTCVGRNGNLFLVGGSNSILDQYETPLSDEKLLSDSRRWVALIERRNLEISGRGAKFLQVLIPEKSSILSEDLPMKLDVPSGWYRTVLESLRERFFPESSILDCARVIAGTHRADEFYRKLDTHFSTFGALSTVGAMLSKLGESLDLPQDVNRLDNHGCGLGPRLLKGMVSEKTLNISEDDIRNLSTGLERVERIVPQDGSHIGIKCVFRRPNAPINKKAVVFGNSFFERGDLTSGLSWWCARLFREFHFIWNPSVDYGYVDAIAPDIVVAQTIERFLPMVPKE